MCSSAYHLASLQFYRDRVAAELAEAKPDTDQDQVDRFSANFPDVHIASSCLQKALRRGEFQFAFAAGRFLLRSDPERLWRRLCVCAFEEFGLVDLGVTARVVAVAASKAFRLVQGEERVLGYLLALLCDLPKDRRLDDLYGVGAAVGWRPQPAEEFGAGTARICYRAAGARVFAPDCCLRTGCSPPLVPGGVERGLRTGSREDGSEGLVDEGLFELCAKGVQLSRCLLPVLLPLAIAATEASGGLGEARVEALPSMPLISGVPAYAFDGFTRTGRACLVQLGVEEPRLKQLLQTVPAAKRLDYLRHLLFVVEGSRASPLIRDDLADRLRSEAVADGMTQDAVMSAVDLITDLLPTLHRLRGELAPASTSEEQAS